jgi:hypothetical protein
MIEGGGSAPPKMVQKFENSNLSTCLINTVKNWLYSGQARARNAERGNFGHK